MSPFKELLLQTHLFLIIPHWNLQLIAEILDFFLVLGFIGNIAFILWNLVHGFLKYVV